MSNNTRDYNVKIIKDDYFLGNYSTIVEKNALVNKMVQKLPNVDVYGEFHTHEQLLTAIDVLIASTHETEHRNEILLRTVLPKISTHPHKFLDIGTGNGDLTLFFGQYFSQITAVDSQETALKNLPDKLGVRNAPIEKIHSSILNEELPIFDEKYDLILLSHVLYYIPEEERVKLIENLYQLLTKNGIMVLIFNSGGSRYQLHQKFNDEFHDLSNLVSQFPEFASVHVFESTEFLTADNINAMLHISSVCLNDANAKVPSAELSHYLENHHKHGEFFQIDMIQNIVIIGASIESF